MEQFGGTSTAGAIVIRGKTDTAPDAAALADPTTATHGVVIGANYDNSGAYLLASRNLADLVIDSDAGGGNPFINVACASIGSRYQDWSNWCNCIWRKVQVIT